MRLYIIFICFVSVATPPTERKKDLVRDRTQSIEESLTHSTDGESEEGGSGSKTNRSDILSRISKMGQNMLPTSSVGTAVGGESNEVCTTINCIIILYGKDVQLLCMQHSTVTHGIHMSD